MTEIAGSFTLTLPGGATADARIGFSSAAQYSSRLRIMESPDVNGVPQGTPFKQFDKPNGGSVRLPNKGDAPKTYYLYGEAKQPGSNDWTTTKWRYTGENSPNLKVVGWEDFGSNEYRDITADIKIVQASREG